MISLVEKELVEFARRLPVHDDGENLNRIQHAKKNGHIVILRDGVKLLGYAEVYRLKSIPNYPVLPYPVDDIDGDILYCFAAVCEDWNIRKLIKLGFESFAGIKRIAYHRNKHGNKLYIIERVKNV